ncbi:MAG TPA: hypothetical protein VNK44_00860 [Candidatus Nitrosotenuis sp.]|nr:hypothetical protein [Candidatus Nitrosotenuis sp.]
MPEDNEVLQYLLIPLHIVSLAGDSFRGKTRLQKIVFLTQKNSKDAFDFQFEPAPLGPLSHKLNHYLERMIKMDLLSETISTTPSGNDVIIYSLTKSGKNLLDFGLKSGYVDPEIQSSIASVSSTYGKMAYVELLDYVHDEYPAYKL